MWKRINLYEELTDLKPGTVISKNPDDTDEYYKVLSHQSQHLTAIKLKGNSTVILTHTDVLITDKWWVQEK